MVGAIKRTLRQTPEKPDAITPSSLTPAHSPPAPTAKIVARVARERKWILFPKQPGKFWQTDLYCDLLSKTLVGGSNCTAFFTNAGRVLTSSFFLSCTLMFTTVL